MKLNIILISIYYILFFSLEAFGKVNNLIVLKVGNKIITNYEIKNKILSNLVLTDQEINQKNIDKIKNQSIDLLIQKKIKEIELDKFKFSVNQNKVKSYLDTISGNDIDSLKQKFKSNNINFDLFIDEIEIQFKWQELIFKTYSKNIKIDKQVVNTEIDKIINNQKNILEFKLLEIEVPISDNDYEKKIKELKNLINEIGFGNVAFEFSISNTSNEKGNLGWISSASLSKEVFKMINNLKIGEISDPILRPGSATLLKLADKRKSNVEKINIEKLKKNLVEKKTNELFKLYSQSLISTLKNSTLIEYKNE